MNISLFDLFSIGIGPSSSHTVGPMLAAKEFAASLGERLEKVSRVKVELYGSLAFTGHGHGTDKAVLNGLEGKDPAGVDPDAMVPRMEAIIKDKSLQLAGKQQISFQVLQDLVFHMDEFLPKHSNGMRFTAYAAAGKEILSTIYYSVGGGFIVSDEEFASEEGHLTPIPYPFDTAEQLLEQCRTHQLSIDALMLENEKAWRDESEIKQGMQDIVDVMTGCIDKGCHTPGILPGGLKVKRRAPALYQKLQNQSGVRSIYEDADIMNRLNVYAIAVNEENAAGGRVVTAPTNGAAGIIPAVLEYYKNFHENSSTEGIYKFMLTAGAIAILYKKGASISGAEVGCQGEVGVASSMAAGALTAALGGSLEQIENAAEIAMEHHLGMTCDPIGGLVQIPCIERNAMGAVKAVNAARMALMGDGTHFVSLDKVIATMKATGRDMMTIYKETSRGGLAVNVPEC